MEAKTVKRILNDINEYCNNPIEDIIIFLAKDGDLSKIYGDITIKKGIYEGLTIPFIIHIPNQYPLIGPAMNIFPGINFNHKFHEHLYDDNINGSSICNDMLTNFENWFKNIDSDDPAIATEWLPDYTLQTILMQMQIFFSESTEKQPSQEQIDNLREELNIFYSEREKCFDKKYKKIVSKVNNKFEDKLICSITKQKFSDNPDMILGYPIKIYIDKYSRLWSTPILELISYDAYVCEIQKNGNKLDKFNTTYFKSTTGQQYNYWIPCYFTKQHFKNCKQTIENALTVLRYGVLGIEKNDFKPEIVLKVLPTLINKAVVAIIKGNLHKSECAIECYCNFLQLFLEYLELYPNLKTIINLEVKSFISSKKARNKLNIPDIGEFIIKLSLSDYKYTDSSVQKILLKEYFSRQMYWMFKTDNDLAKTFYQTHNIDLKRAFAASNVSSSILVFALEVAKFFIFPGVRDKLNQFCGFPPINVINKFQKRIKYIKNNIVDYRTLISEIKYSHTINNDLEMKTFLRECCVESYEQGYTTFDPDYKKNQARGRHRKPLLRHQRKKRNNKRKEKTISIPITIDEDNDISNNPFSVLIPE